MWGDLQTGIADSNSKTSPPTPLRGRGERDFQCDIFCINLSSYFRSHKILKLAHWLISYYHICNSKTAHPALSGRGKRDFQCDIFCINFSSYFRSHKISYLAHWLISYYHIVLAFITFAHLQICTSAHYSVSASLYWLFSSSSSPMASISSSSSAPGTSRSLPVPA